MNNIYRDATYSEESEIVTELLAHPGMRIERITSSGQISDDWYDQEEDEWVILLQGSALLQIEGDAEPARLSAGDYVFLPAHLKHKVIYTAKECLWLCIFAPAKP